jgi:hypothetical protein
LVIGDKLISAIKKEDWSYQFIAKIISFHVNRPVNKFECTILAGQILGVECCATVRKGD